MWFWQLAILIGFGTLLSACSFDVQGITEQQIVDSETEANTLEQTDESDALQLTSTPSMTPLPSSTPIPEIQATATVESTVTPNPYLTSTPSQNAIYPPEYNPLTGQMAIYPDNLLRSPLMVKISNYPRDIRPQAGLSKADIVFEYYIGAFMNRFLAVFYGENAEWAGPIRSGRLIDGQLAMNYHSALVYGGADVRVNEVIKNPEVVGNLAVDTRVYDQCPPLCGTETHSLDGLYVDTAGMSEDLFNQGYDASLKPRDLETISFSDELLENGTANVDEIEIIISEVCRSKWVYDETVKRYIRWEEEGDSSSSYVGTFDLLSPEQQLEVSNVIILFSDYVVYDSLLHDVRIHYADEPMPARFFRNGQMVEGSWSGFEIDEPLQFLNSDGLEYSLFPGKSWVIIVTKDSTLNQITDKMWRLEFITP